MSFDWGIGSVPSWWYNRGMERRYSQSPIGHKDKEN